MARRWIRRVCTAVLVASLLVAGADAISLWRDEAQFDALWRLAYHMPRQARRSRLDVKAGGDGGVDLEALRALNPQCVGYISIRDTPLSYPVMQTDEENGMFYLTHAFDRSYHGNGTPFLDMRCSTKTPSDNLIVYGHNTRNTKMFSCLRFYREEAYFREHPVIRFDHENGGDYQIFAVLFESLSDESNRELFAMVDRTPESGEEWEAFLDYLKKERLYDTGVEAEVTDKLLTLSTCYRAIDNGRVLIFAKKQPEK